MSEIIIEETLSPEQMEELEAALAAEVLRQQEERQEILDRQAKNIEAKLSSRLSSKSVKHTQMLEALKLYLGSLANGCYLNSTDELFQYNSDTVNARRPEHNIILNKCQVAISQTISYQFAAGDKNWSLRAPTVVEVDEIDMQQVAGMTGNPNMSPGDVAEYRAMLMEKEIEYHLDCTKYAPEARKVMSDRVVLGTGVLKGPMNAGKLKKIYRRQQTSDGQFIRIPEFTQEHNPLIYRVNPLYFFPDDSVTDIEKAEDSIEIHPMSKTDLKDLLKHPGYFSDQIAEVLKDEGPKSYVNSPFTDPSYVTQGTSSMKDKYLVLEYHGPIKRSDLEILGRSPAVESDSEEFYADIWVVNGRTIRLELENIEGCYRVPYCVSVWESDPASIFGFGVPMLARDQQRVVNETYKMMLDNAGLSAGPQVVVDPNKIKPMDGSLECSPFKVWYVNGDYGTGDSSNSIQFFTPSNSYEGLASVFMMAKGLADEESSIPNFAPNAGNPTGAGDSATGMAIFNQNANSPLFYKAEDWDDCITRPLLEMMLEWEMQFNPKDEIKGSYELDVRTSTSMLRNNIEQQELSGLSQEIANGSPTAEWINTDALIMARLARSKLPGRDIVKSPDQVAKERANAQPPPPDPNMLKAQAELSKVEVEKQKVELEKQRLIFEQQTKAQELQMKYEAQLRTDQTREREANASVIKAQLDYQGRMAELAARSEHDRARIIADLQKSQISIEADKFLAGMQIPLKVKDQQIKEQELQIKRVQGSGVTGVR